MIKNSRGGFHFSRFDDVVRRSMFDSVRVCSDGEGNKEFSRHSTFFLAKCMCVCVCVYVRVVERVRTLLGVRTQKDVEGDVIFFETHFPKRFS